MVSAAIMKKKRRDSVMGLQEGFMGQQQPIVMEWIRVVEGIFI
jgi:hypothetical protein